MQQKNELSDQQGMLFMSSEIEEILDIDTLSVIEEQEHLDKLYCVISSSNFTKKLEVEKYSKKYYKKILSFFVDIETAARFLMEENFDIKIYYNKKEIIHFDKDEDLFYNIIKDKERYRLDITIYEGK